MGVHIPHGKGQFWGRKGAPHWTVQGHCAVICAKTTKPIQMPFGLWAQMGPMNHVLYGGPAMLTDVAMATNFGMQFAIIGSVGYNCGCMIASDTLFDSRCGFSGTSYSMKTQPFLQDSLVWQTDQQTDQPTDHAVWSVIIGRIYIHSTAMRPKNNNKYIHCLPKKVDHSGNFVKS